MFLKMSHEGQKKNLALILENYKMNKPNARFAITFSSFMFLFFFSGFGFLLCLWQNKPSHLAEH